jgi:hypothetical protein
MRSIDVPSIFLKQEQLIYLKRNASEVIAPKNNQSHELTENTGFKYLPYPLI